MPLESIPPGFPIDLLSRYDRISFLARGGMGVLFKAHDKTLNKEVSIKALPTRAQVGSRRVVRFQKEARAAGRLSHPNIVQVLDFGVTKTGDPYLVMDYIQGISLEEQISKIGALEVSKALMLFIQIVDGLSHAHNHGVIHRDIKSSNIMLETSDPEKPVAKIVDFGVAHMRVTEVDRAGFDSTGSNLVGSPGYMGPEIIDGKKADQRSDVYALGCLMFETIVGDLPFHGNTALDTMAKHKQAPIPNITSRKIKTVNPQLAQAMGEIIEICLAKNPDERFQDAEELKGDLVECAKIFDREIRDAVNQIVIDRKNFFQSMIRPFKGSQKVPVFKMLFLGLFVLSCSIAAKVLMPLVMPILTPHVHNMMGESTKREKKQIKKPHPTAFLGSDNIFLATERHFTDERMKSGEIKPLGKEMDLRGGELTDASIPFIAKMRITELDLSDNDITDKGLIELAKCQNLSSVRLDRIKSISDRGVIAVAGLPNLTHLSVLGTKITAESLKRLSQSKHLNILSLPLCKSITTKGVRQLKAVPYLGRINIGWTGVSTSALSGFPTLGHVELGTDTAFTKEDLAALQAIPNLNTITFLKGTVAPDVLKELVKCKRLKYIRLEFVNGLSKQELDRFEYLYEHVNHTELQISSFIIE